MAQKKTHRVRRLLTQIGLGLVILISLGLIFNEQIKDWMITSYQPKVTQASVKQGHQQPADYDFKAVKSLDFSTVAKARWNSNHLAIVGELLIPDDDVHLPIGQGVSNDTLALAAGTMRSNQQMGTGNYALAGHHMTSKTILFSPLYWKARVGQTIYLSDQHNVYEYKMTVRKFIPATDVQVVDQTKKPMITLITCDATGANRLMIRGSYVRKMAYKNAPSQVKKEFAAKFNNRYTEADE
ncbi:class A sortase [Levilactobacillus bambusae]|uniref:Class A sortase n=1 Tax=Levilactobacillus bambusae TaxID=2024736 RepID=A0A2V1MWS6_9LACO|nr:class A sortase [Levilactobacillus bambusae]PWF99312.1 class A sortase [Levilactobacillus bambusae]